MIKFKVKIVNDSNLSLIVITLELLFFIYKESAFFYKILFTSIRLYGIMGLSRGGISGKIKFR